MEGIKKASLKEMEGYNKVIKTYNYATGTVIRVYAHDNPKIKKKLYEYDAFFSESVYDTTVTVFCTFDKDVFAIAGGRSSRYKFIESHFR